MNRRSLRILPLVAVAFVLIALCSTASGQCGVERWSVKTGTDPDSGLVNLSSSTATPISSMTALPAPSPIPANNRVQPTETTVWVINATLTQYKLESDSDYHSVQITGIGMFDFLHGQTGVAPNGIELHPVIDIIFNPSQTSDFSISSSPASVSIVQGSSGTTTISTTISGSFNSAVALSAAGLPTGASASFSPTSIAAPGSGSSQMSITVGSSTVTGTYNVTVTGTGGGKTHTSNVSLTVTASGGGGTTQQLLGNPGFENGSSNPAPWTVSTGVIDSSTSEAAHTGSWKAWMDGYGTTHTDTLLQQVAIPSNTTSATLSFWKHIDTAETTTTTAYDTLTVQIRNSSGGVLATLATYSNLNAATGYQQVSFDFTSYKGQTIQVYLVGTEDSQKQTSFVVDDFALNATTSGTADTTPPTTSVTAPANGATVSGTVTISATASDNVGVTKMEIYIDGALKTSNTNLASISYSWNTTTYSNGSHAIVSKAYDAAGNVGSSTTVTVTVSNAGGTTTELITNNGFEGTLSPWILGGVKVPIDSTARIHSGANSMRLGATTAQAQLNLMAIVGLIRV